MKESVFKESHPCKHCGDIRRYIKSGACPTCKAMNQRRYRAAKTGCKPSRPYRAKAQAIEPAREPHRAPTGLLATLVKLFSAPLNIFRSTCKLGTV